MAKVFLDTNIYIDVAQRDKDKMISLKGNLLYISPLSVHILFYAYKFKVTEKQASELLEKFGIVYFTKEILEKAFEGPTKDLEDNIQLHSAAEEDCDIFLTTDKKLLQMKFFGKTKIASTMTSQ